MSDYSDDDFKMARIFTTKELAKALWAELFCDDPFESLHSEDGLINNDCIAGSCEITPDDIPKLVEKIIMDYGIPLDVRPLITDANRHRI